MAGKNDTALPVYFFVHVMKTGGTTLVAHLRDNFGPRELEAQGIAGTDRRVLQPGDVLIYEALSRVEALSPERRAEIRCYAGHYPYFVTELVKADITFTVLREPVARSVSMLRQIQRHDPPDRVRSLEEIYETDGARWTHVENYQSRQFALTFDDVRAAAAEVDEYYPGSGWFAIEKPSYVYFSVDDARLERARNTLGQVDVIGLQERYDEFLDTLHRRFGWRFPVDYRYRVAAQPDDVPAPLLKTIAADNEADIDLYRWAVDEVARRR